MQIIYIRQDYLLSYNYIQTKDYIWMKNAILKNVRGHWKYNDD